jgi:hypothetical protein
MALLGELDCPEAANVLAKRLLPPAAPHEYLKRVGAFAFIKLSHAPAAEFVYRFQRFGARAEDAFYFRDLFVVIRESTRGFRNALAEQAIPHLNHATGTPEHAKAVGVLAYVGDDRLVEHLAARFAENSLLAGYENHALIALGTDAAGALFARSISAVGERLASLPNDQAHHDARNTLIWPVYFASADIRFLLTSAFEPHLRRLLEDSNREVSRIASRLAKRGRIASLLYPMALAAAKQQSRIEFERDEERECVTSDAWLGWWRESTDESVRHALLDLLPLSPSVEIEEILLECLDVPQLSRPATRGLGEYGSVRAAPHLRNLLAEAIRQSDVDAVEVADALGKLRDTSSVPLLKQFAESVLDSWAARHAVMSLGFIGTKEAERALVEMLEAGHGEDVEDLVHEGLLACGSREAVSRVVARAKMK